MHTHSQFLSLLNLNIYFGNDDGNDSHRIEQDCPLCNQNSTLESKLSTRTLNHSFFSALNFLISELSSSTFGCRRCCRCCPAQAPRAAESISPTSPLSLSIFSTAITNWQTSDSHYYHSCSCSFIIIILPFLSLPFLTFPLLLLLFLSCFAIIITLLCLCSLSSVSCHTVGKQASKHTM